MTSTKCHQMWHFVESPQQNATLCDSLLRYVNKLAPNVAMGLHRIWLDSQQLQYIHGRNYWTFARDSDVVLRCCGLKSLQIPTFSNICSKQFQINPRFRYRFMMFSWCTFSNTTFHVASCTCNVSHNNTMLCIFLSCLSAFVVPLCWGQPFQYCTDTLSTLHIFNF